MLLATPMKPSLVIPCFNEQENLSRLFTEVDAMAASWSGPIEIILVDDGSRDQTAAMIKAKAQTDPRYQAIVFRRNFGQTAAMVAGFDRASGDVVVPLDADLQNDPADIPRLVAERDRGFDGVSGWR